MIFLAFLPDRIYWLSYSLFSRASGRYFSLQIIPLPRADAIVSYGVRSAVIIPSSTRYDLIATRDKIRSKTAKRDYKKSPRKWSFFTLFSRGKLSLRALLHSLRMSTIISIGWYICSPLNIYNCRMGTSHITYASIRTLQNFLIWSCWYNWSISISPPKFHHMNSAIPHISPKCMFTPMADIFYYKLVSWKKGKKSTPSSWFMLIYPRREVMIIFRFMWKINNFAYSCHNHINDVILYLYFSFDKSQYYLSSL